jgi:hypothetical protein
MKAETANYERAERGRFTEIKMKGGKPLSLSLAIPAPFPGELARFDNSQNVK